MLNNVVLIGRIANDLELHQTQNGKDVCSFNLAITRSFKNENGVYESDFITCKLWSGIAKTTVEFCTKGSLIAVKGRLQTRHYENKESKNVYVTEVIAERINFLNT